MRYDSEEGRFTLVFLASPDDVERCGGIPDGKLPTQMDIPMVELTFNWDPEDYGRRPKLWAFGLSRREHL